MIYLLRPVGCDWVSCATIAVFNTVRAESISKSSASIKQSQTVVVIFLWTCGSIILRQRSAGVGCGKRLSRLLLLITG
jgi:hypothetical protein